MHCLLLTLEREGYIQRSNPRAPYLPGARLMTLSGKALAGAGLREKALPEMRKLMKGTMLTVHMAIPEGEQVTLVVQLAPASTRVVTFLGQRFGWHCTALGKAIVAHLPAEVMEAMIQGHALAPHNEQTITSPRKLSGDLALTQRRGYAIDDEEDVMGFRCLGAPLFDAEGLPVAAISLMGTVAQITDINVNAFAAELCETAKRISAGLGTRHQAGRL